MNYWLMKSEPGEYSYNDLVEEGVGTWDGVRNYQARNNLKEMATGDKVLFYYSGKKREVVGIAEVVREYFPDPTIDDDRWVAVQVKPLKEFLQPVSLAEIKNNTKLKDLTLVRNSRLSVMPVSPDEFDEILNMAARG